MNGLLASQASLGSLGLRVAECSPWSRAIAAEPTLCSVSAAGLRVATGSPWSRAIGSVPTLCSVRAARDRLSAYAVLCERGSRYTGGRRPEP